MNRILIAALVVLITACEKTPPTEAPPPVVITPENRITRMERDGVTLDINYDDAGKIYKAVLNQGGTINTYQFVYSNNKLSEIDFSFGGKWMYTYNGDQLARIETINNLGQTRYRRELVYNSNGTVSESREYLVSISGTVSPQFKTLYEYDSNGNITRKLVYYYINHDWDLEETIVLSAYDGHVNTSQHLEVFPFLPPNLLGGSNPGKEEYIDKSGPATTVITHAYTYDSKGRPITRNSKIVSPGLPDTFSDMRLVY